MLCNFGCRNYSRLDFVILFADGQLRNIETDEPFKFEVKEGDRAYNQKHYEALGEVHTSHYNIDMTLCTWSKFYESIKYRKMCFIVFCHIISSQHFVGQDGIKHILFRNL